MAKTVTFTQLRIEGIGIDAPNKLIVVNYEISDATGKIRLDRQAVFYQTIPETPPDLVDTLQLTPAQAQTAVTLYNELKTALTSYLTM